MRYRIANSNRILLKVKITHGLNKPAIEDDQLIDDSLTTLKWGHLKSLEYNKKHLFHSENTHLQLLATYFTIAW